MGLAFQSNPAITPEEAAHNAIAQQRLEGLQPSEAFIADLKQVASGGLALKTALSNIEKRLQRVQIRR